MIEDEIEAEKIMRATSLHILSAKHEQHTLLTSSAPVITEKHTWH